MAIAVGTTTRELLVEIAARLEGRTELRWAELRYQANRAAKSVDPRDLPVLDAKGPVLP